jgi:hypothetical protein
MAEAFTGHINGHGDPDNADTWTVISLPTGTGKTQGAILYCAILSQLLETPVPLHPGVLIVTKLIDDADHIAADINKLSRQYSPGMTDRGPSAVSYHSKKKHDLRREDLQSFPCLVITHRAYELALETIELGACDSGPSAPRTWDCFHAYNGSRRKLVIIDEAIDLLDEAQLDVEQVRLLLGHLPDEVRKKYPIEVAFLEELQNFFEDIPKVFGDQPMPDQMMNQEPALNMVVRVLQEKHGWEVTEEDDRPTDGMKGKPFPDFGGLRNTLRKVRFDQQLWQEDPEESERLRGNFNEIISSADALYKQWRWYTKAENMDTMNTARLLVPDSVKGAVVLDATAAENVFYDIFAMAKRLPPVPETRRYGNVTLNVSTGHKVGKVYMRENAEELCNKLISDLEGRVQGSSVLVITHKDVKPHLHKETQGFILDTAHWGAVNGSNHWQDCDTVVIFGLPYRPDTWSHNAFMACQGPMDDEWLRATGRRHFGNYPDIKEALITGQLVTDTIQAINRIRCRKVIDAQGNCPKADIYLLLPPGNRAEVILSGIKTAMPGIQVKKWRYTAQKRRKYKSKHEEALRSYLQVMGTGRIAATTIKRELKISKSTFDRLTARIRENDPEDPLVQALTEAGVSYETGREGNVPKAYFVKRG